MSPIFPFIKINVDASWVASSGSGFVGIVVRDEEGKFLAARKAGNCGLVRGSG